MKNFLIGGLICLVATSYAQSPMDTMYVHYTINHPVLKKIDIHVTKDKQKRKKPLIVYLDGSGNFPIFFKNKDGRYSSSVPLRARKYASEYHVAMISKPSVPFSDSIRYSENGRRYYPETQDFYERYSLDWRAQAASEAINFLIKTLPIDTDKIIVMGYSEGSQVAPAVAVLNKKVTHVVCMVGNSLNHLYDFLLDARVQAERNQLTAIESQQLVDSLYREYEKIYADPLSTSKFWYGSTYLKWSSFSKVTPLENMLKLSIPILYIGGGKDRNQTVIDMDYAKLEFMRKGKTNLTYKVYPESNHFFMESYEENGQQQWKDRVDEVHTFALEWVKSHPK
ncbi:MAG: acyl-CoA thioester hydrolase/BAAT C-terminal domain-containing protein [Cyclobacteriaceae bacterium]